MKKVIYLDNAATTKVRPEVVEAMLPFYTEYYGNPSAVYEFSTPCKEALAKARETVANALGAKDNEIYFTNGGSESDNWALIATAEAYVSKGKHIITTKIEHHAILHTCEYLEKRGYEITYLPVDEYGSVSIDELKKAIRPDTILISVMFANNEIGTIQPIREIGEIAHENGIIFHTDAVQAFCHEPINVDEYHIDMLSASGHKFHGPKGVGFLYIRKGLKLRSFIHGGAQERKRRGGTENVPGAVGMAAALREAGCTVTADSGGIRALCRERLRAVGPVQTAPYPGFPTDAQAVLMAALLRSRGATVFEENIFENRYRHVDELIRMGASIRVSGRVAVVTGVERLHSAPVRCTDLRGGAALCVAALAAEGETRVSQICHIDRGYEDLARDLRALGADAVRVEETENG